MQTVRYPFVGPLAISASALCVASVLSLPSVWAGDRHGDDDDSDDRDAPSITLRLPNSTQGPLWPPSEVVNEDGDFILIGQMLSEVAPGVIVPVPEQAVLVSKETVPPLNEEGVEDFSNVLGAEYEVIRPLDLSPGSPDLDMVLYTLSYGPFEGNFGGGPRIPREGESTYNLNGALPSCLELFPTDAQSTVYTRASYPFHEAPIWGFQGDQVAYDVETGEPFDPNDASGADCPEEGCPGENTVDFRRTEPFTLGEYLRARGTVAITLTDYDAEVGAYTAARFDFRFRQLPPRSLFTIWSIRQNSIEPRPALRLPDPLGIPNVFISDDKGRATYSVVVPNPFPDPATDDAGLRIIGLAVDYHSDYQNWGACPARLGPGVEIHAIFNTPAKGIMDITEFVTKPASEL